MENTQETSKRKQEWSITYKQLGVLILAFSLGIIAALLFSSASVSTPTTFSTTQLISFVLTVILSGASIVLAISAISLGRSSEQSVIQRSDESIRLQNEVFQKTTDALQRIESSTGVTEKRIEDIISGRVGDLSQKIAQIATEKQEAPGGLNAQEIEKMIKKSLYQSLREEGALRSRAARYEERRHMEEEKAEKERIQEQQSKEYKTHSTRFLQALSSRDDLKAMKMGRGKAYSSGDDVFDGIYLRKDGKRIGIIDFAIYHPVLFMTASIATSLHKLQSGSIAQVHVILYEENEPFERAFAESIAIADPKLKSRISLTVCPPDKIEETAAALAIANN